MSSSPANATSASSACASPGRRSRSAQGAARARKLPEAGARTRPAARGVAPGQRRAARDRRRRDVRDCLHQGSKNRTRQPPVARHLRLAPREIVGQSTRASGRATRCSGRRSRNCSTPRCGVARQARTSCNWCAATAAASGRASPDARSTPTTRRRDPVWVVERHHARTRGDRGNPPRARSPRTRRA